MEQEINQYDWNNKSSFIYLAKQDNPFKQDLSLAHLEVSKGHFFKKHCPSTPTLCP
jgi:hypothetical protein